MHSYVRITGPRRSWKWSPSIAAAYQRTIWLNDRYELDGSDNVAWVIVGKRAPGVWAGAIYVTRRTGPKFNSTRYIEQIGRLERVHV